MTSKNRLDFGGDPAHATLGLRLVFGFRFRVMVTAVLVEVCASELSCLLLTYSNKQEQSADVVAYLNRTMRAAGNVWKLLLRCIIVSLFSAILPSTCALNNCCESKANEKSAHRDANTARWL